MSFCLAFGLTLTMLFRGPREAPCWHADLLAMGIAGERAHQGWSLLESVSDPDCRSVGGALVEKDAPSATRRRTHDR